MASSLHLAPTPASVAQARRWSRQEVAPVADADAADVVALLVSELVSNVVLHAGTDCILRVVSAGDRIRIEVVDADDRLPAGPDEFDPHACSGRGLLLVQRLSEAYGIAREAGGGKRVWCEVAARATLGRWGSAALADQV